MVQVTVDVEAQVERAGIGVVGQGQMVPTAVADHAADTDRIVAGGGAEPGVGTAVGAAGIAAERQRAVAVAPLEQ